MKSVCSTAVSEGVRRQNFSTACIWLVHCSCGFCRVQLPRNLSTEWLEDWPVHILETTMYKYLWIWLLNFYEQKDFSRFLCCCKFAETAWFSSAVGKVVHGFLHSCRWQSRRFIHKSGEGRSVQRMAEDYPSPMLVSLLCMQEHRFLLKSGCGEGMVRNLSTAWITSKLIFW